LNKMPKLDALQQAVADLEENLGEPADRYKLYAEWLEETLGVSVPPIMAQVAVQRYHDFQASDKNHDANAERMAAKAREREERAAAAEQRRAEAAEKAEAREAARAEREKARATKAAEREAAAAARPPKAAAKASKAAATTAETTESAPATPAKAAKKAPAKAAGRRSGASAAPF
jgi:hypothetical protein